MKQRPFFGAIINPFGRNADALGLDGEYLKVIRRGEAFSISLRELSAPPRLHWGLFGTTMRLPAGEGPEIILRATKRADAVAFSELLGDAWKAFNVAAFHRESERFSRLHAAVADLDAPRCYPAASPVGRLLEEVRSFDVEVLSKLQLSMFSEDERDKISRVQEFIGAPRAAREKAVAIFVEQEIACWKEFFDTVESKPLTPEQRHAVVADEDATLILAGAGSGKTSVISAKAAYLVKAGIRRPEEILLLAFAANAAKEMSERLAERSGIPVAVRTFHALAYDIIGSVEGSKPALAPHATDDFAFLALIKEILRDLVRTVASVAAAIIEWFAQFLATPSAEWDYETKHDYYCQLRDQDLRTLQGEQVKSYEELLISNWLYLNGIDYVYEPDYAHAVVKDGRRQYCPDFQLKESGVYIEHFGVRRERTSGGGERLTTAPFVNRDEYLAGMDWKRDVHASHETILIETYSYEQQEGRLLTGLAEKLKPYVKLRPRTSETIFDRVVELGHVDRFSQLLGTFLRKFKSGGYGVSDCEAKSERMKMGKRAKAFFLVFGPVLEAYERRLGDHIDFEDMILRAASYVETGRFQSPYLHILVDEFQDISQSRARLVKALKEQCPGAKIYGVGDDWQSIFRFAGSDIHLMANFGEEFGGSFDGESGQHQKVDLGRTFRSVDQIAFAARTFVLKNPAQISKRIVPAGAAKEPVIRIVETERGEESAKLEEVLSTLARRVASGGRTSVMLLGRYRRVEPGMAALQRQFPQLEVSFKTIHASKGLEADHVILLGANSGRGGFPSEMADDPLLSLVSPEEEAYPHAEERRVMYVAMTRARQTLTILASISQPSVFVTELQKELVLAEPRTPKVKPSIVHRCGMCGGRLVGLRQKNGGVRYRCEHAKLCGNNLPPCTSCGTGLPRRTEDSSVALCECGVAQQCCQSCEEGWLVERKGPHGAFLGCVRYPSCTGKGVPVVHGGGVRRIHSRA